MVKLTESINPGEYQEALSDAVARMAAETITARIWARDHTVWKPEDEGISNRLGWLNAASDTLRDAERLHALRKGVVADGYERVLWLGMGGSSLAPDVFARIFGPTNGGLPLDVLDSTDPGAVLAHAGHIDPARTLFVVATKSGTTAETISFFKFFYNRVVDVVGEEGAGAHFVAITDADTPLDRLSTDLGFREVFRNDPTIGGRYSALSYFGMVAAALLGVDVETFLQRASDFADRCRVEENPAARLGAIMGVLAHHGRDKLTLISSPTLAPFGDWVEQLVAESTGKEGTGILPVVGETPGADPQVYGPDRLFVVTTLQGEPLPAGAVDALVQAGHPVVQIEVGDPYDLGGLMFLWELATAVAGYHLGINPFNQPNVESAKRRAREMMDAYREQGALPALDPLLQDGGITVDGDVTAGSVVEALREFVRQTQPGGDIALHAYVAPTESTTSALRDLQTRLRDATGQAVTLGYGPRFLHSTGQLHKGDAGKGLFVQLIGGGDQDAPIPDEAGADASSITFGVLKRAQALGDRQALLDAGRRVLTFDLGGDVVGGIRRLIDRLS